jgi:iron complex outermembrane receptor protein
MLTFKPHLKRNLILSTVLSAGLVLPATSWAQAAAPATAAAAAAPAAGSVSEVIVTAERRATNVQKTPLAISTVARARLDQSFINNIAGLNATVPSLEITKASGFENLVTIRGVGSATPENSLTTTPGVSLFIDGVYIANTISLDETLFDVNNIQILHGPQGALYGQSSIGGAILIESNQPELKELSGQGDFSAGSYNLYRGRLEVNVPLGDDFATRLSFQKFNHSGFTRDAAIPGFYLDEANDVSGKVALLWQPTDKFKATLTADLYKSNQAGDAQKNVNDPEPDPRVVFQDYPGHFELSTQLYHANVQYDAPWFTIRSVTGYQVLDHVQQEDSSRSAFSILHIYDDVAAWNTAVRNFTEEFDIMSLSSSRLNWIVGGFYLNQTSHQFVVEFEQTTCYPFCSPPSANDLIIQPDIKTNPPSNLAYGNDSHATRQSYALFGQATYPVTDQFRVTAGARINLDNTEDPSFNFSAFGSSLSNNKRWDSVPTWRFEADYQLAPDNMVYASYARGYKPGGANGSNDQFLIAPVFEPETNDAFEIGSKNTFLDHTLRVNVAAFYYIHKNFQYIETDPKPFDGGISNIPQVNDYGVETEANYVSPNSRFHLDAALAYERGEVATHYKTINSTIADYLQGPYFTGANSDGFDAAHAYGACAFYASFSSPACWQAVADMAVDIKGKTPPAMPALSGSVSASYRFDIPSGALTPRIEYVYRGQMWARVFNDPTLDKVPAYDVVNLNLTYEPTGTRLKLALTATNVFDVAGINSRYTDPYGTFQTSDQYIPPRQIIGTIAYAF